MIKQLRALGLSMGTVCAPHVHEDEEGNLVTTRRYLSWTTGEAKPFPKSQQLGRGEKRYRRKIASPKAWQAITAAKRGSCRVCKARPGTSFHHIVPRDFHGDDIAENIAPLCFECHILVTLRDAEACRDLCAALTDAEYAYAIGKCGEGVFERIYGVTYGRQA